MFSVFPLVSQVTVGNFEAPVGYVNYSWEDQTMLYILIGIVSAIVLVLLVVLLVHILLPRRNRFRKGLPEDPLKPGPGPHWEDRVRDRPRNSPRARRRQDDTPVADFYSPGWQPPTRKYFARS